MSEIPSHRRPSGPGYHLREILEVNGLTQQQFADQLGIERHRLNEILNGKRSVTPDTALRLARVLGTSPELWLNLQRQIDLYDAMQGPTGKALAKLKPLELAHV